MIPANHWSTPKQWPFSVKSLDEFGNTVLSECKENFKTRKVKKVYIYNVYN